jgi:hypothetical protein
MHVFVFFDIMMCASIKKALIKLGVLGVTDHQVMHVFVILGWTDDS